MRQGRRICFPDNLQPRIRPCCSSSRSLRHRAARPERFRMMPSAAELIGSVRTIPMTTETTMPMMNGRCSVAQLMMLPRPVIIWEIGGPTSSPTTEPAPMVMTGVTMISTLVLPETRWPQVMPAKAAMKAPSGSPGPARTAFPSTKNVPPVILPA